MFDRLQPYGLRLNMKKCYLGVDSVNFLGLDIKAGGKIAISEDKRRAAMNLKVPVNIRELRSLLGFVSFFKRFIPDYLAIVTPLLICLKESSFKIEEEQR